MGDLTDKIGSKPEVLEVHRKALEIRQNLADDSPTVTGFLNDLAKSHNNIGNLQSVTGHPDEAAPVLHAGAGDLAEAGRRQSQRHCVPEGPREEPQQHRRTAARHWAFGRGAAVLRAVLEIQKKLADTNPDVTGFLNDLAASHNNIGLLLSETGRRTTRCGPTSALEIGRG